MDNIEEWGWCALPIINIIPSSLIHNYEIQPALILCFQTSHTCLRLGQVPSSIAGEDGGILCVNLTVITVTVYQIWIFFVCVKFSNFTPPPRRKHRDWSGSICGLSSPVIVVDALDHTLWDRNEQLDLYCNEKYKVYLTETVHTMLMRDIGL